MFIYIYICIYVCIHIYIYTPCWVHSRIGYMVQLYGSCGPEGFVLQRASLHGVTGPSETPRAPSEPASVSRPFVCLLNLFFDDGLCLKYIHIGTSRRRPRPDSSDPTRDKSKPGKTETKAKTMALELSSMPRQSAMTAPRMPKTLCTTATIGIGAKVVESE